MACAVPILFLTFNRPEQTRQVLEQICLADPSRLYVHSDGPRMTQPADRKKVSDVRKLIQEKIAHTSIELHTRYRDKNAGLRKGVFDAISWFFEQEEYGIILEDDCLPDPTLFQFCSELLLKYRHDERIMHIGCSNLSETECSHISSSYLFSKFSFVWGWASWRRAWKSMEINFKGLEAFKRKGELERFLPNSQARTYLIDKFQSTRDGKINSWAFSWFYSIVKSDGICIVPKVNLVQNTGIGTSEATNTKHQNTRAQIRAQAMEFPLNHPEQQEIDLAMEEMFFFATQKPKTRLRLWTILHKLGIR